MIDTNIRTARAFIAALPTGTLPDAIVAPDMTAWTTSTGAVPGAAYREGVRLLATLFRQPTVYAVDAITAQDDRAVVEAAAEGTLIDGTTYANRYVFILRILDGRIVAITEHFDPRVVMERIIPLFAAARTNGG